MPKRRPPAKNLLAAVLLLGFVGGIQTVDPIISSVALVRASSELHFTANITALASGISTLALAATVIASGLLADKLGRRKVLLAALLISIVGDVLVAMSTGTSMYLLGRVIAGIGLGGVFSAAFAYVRAVAGNKLGTALGQFSAMGGVTTMLGGLVGGVLVTTNWRLAYLVVPIFCVLAFVLVPLLLPKEPAIKGVRIDGVGLGLIALGTTGILYGISKATDSLTAPITWVPILVGICSLVIFAVLESNKKNPILPMSLFKSRVFIAAVISVMLWNLFQAVIVLQLSNLWQYVEHFTPTKVTFGQLPLSVVSIVAAIIAGRSLTKGKSPRSRILLGFVLIALGFGSLFVLPTSGTYMLYLPALLLIGVGLPYVVIASGQLFMSEAPPKFFGPVTSSKTTIGQFGYALGLAGSMVMVDNLTKAGITQKLTAANVPPFQVGQALDSVSQYVNTGVHANTEAARSALQVAAQSYSSAFSTTMLIMAVTALLAGVTSFMLIKK